GVAAGNRIAVAVDFDAELTVDPDSFQDRRLIRQRMQGLELFLSEEFLGRFVGLAVNPNIGHRVQPIARGRIDQGKIRQLQTVEEVLFDVAHAVFNAAFFLGLPDATGPELEAVMVGKIQVTRVEDYRAGRSAQDGDLGIVDPDLTSAVLDRLLHHAETVTIEGKSFRMKDQIEEP